jgi:hypothetical protein
VGERCVSFPKTQNRLLASLPPAVFGAIKLDLKLVELNRGDVLAEAGVPTSRLFPALWDHLLVVELNGRDMIETATVGRAGVIGVASALEAAGLVFVLCRNAPLRETYNVK